MGLRNLSLGYYKEFYRILVGCSCSLWILPSLKDIWVWCLDLLNWGISCNIYRAGYKYHWRLSGCISTLESASLFSSISTVGFLNPSNNNDYSHVISYINIHLINLYFSFWKEIFNYRDIYCLSLFNNSNILFLLNIYSDSNQSTLKYLKDIEANIQNIIVITSDFNIRDRDWDPEYSFHSVHSSLLLEITDSFNLSFLHPSNLVLTRYSDNNNDSNSVINLMFLRFNSLELDNYSILPDLQYLLDYAPLVVDIQIIKEFVQDIRCTIIISSEDKIKFISDVLKISRKSTLFT